MIRFTNGKRQRECGHKEEIWRVCDECYEFLTGKVSEKVFMKFTPNPGERVLRRIRDARVMIDS